MSEVVTNGLAGARSAYLRTAMHQPVDWNEWGEEAFAKARAEDKPVLLDVGAVWCHWCHVMDRESYENAETAEIINKFFVPVKVDRDERPDVDARYQAAVAAISGQSGWPLTAFLTPDGKPYFAGTYFPPVDGHGRPSFRRVLFTMAEAFEKRRDEVEDSAASVMAAIEQNESFDGSARDPGEALVEKIVAACLQQFDPQNGGFGSQPKFPSSGALDLLIDEAGREEGREKKEEKTASAAAAAMVTLEKMARGGIYDHLAGGFHRYSVDERWVVPHFEKMSYDNSELLKNYVHAYQTFGDAGCARVARETIAWVDKWMSDRERGGFYASQDADFSLDDDGDYFTWTRTEAAEVLTAEELAVVEPYYDIGPVGDMHHNFEKNTLHVERPLAEVAHAAGVSTDRAAELLAGAKAKMVSARELLPTPYVDKTVYTAWNSMMASAYLQAGRVLGDAGVVEFGLKSLRRMVGIGKTNTGDTELAQRDTELSHVVSYGEGGGDGERVPGTLEDYVFAGIAALDAWEVTGECRWFEAGLALGEAAARKFYDEDNGGFFDTERAAEGEVRLGALSARRKPLQDSPSPGGNAVAAMLLVRLAELTGRDDLRGRAQATLECFAGVVEHFGLHCASYGLALRRMVLPPVQVVVLGADGAADALERAALKGFAVNKSVVRLREAGRLPPSLAETIPHLPRQEGSFAVVCRGFACGLPVTAVEELAAQLLG
jgi:uncharacterized protein YyaL (SSP411 family)